MEENWIKIYEIEYTSDDLSKQYNENKNYTEKTSINLEELVKDIIFVKRLKENCIPYRCKWDEKECEEQYPRWSKSRVRRHFFILIYIPKNYEARCEEIFACNLEGVEGIKELENTANEEELYEPSEKAKKLFDNIMKTIFFITLISIVYAIIESILS